MLGNHRHAVFAFLSTTTAFAGAALAAGPITNTPVPGQAAQVVTLATGMTAPVGAVPDPTNASRLFITDQAGQVRIFDKTAGLLPDPFLNVTSKLSPLLTSYDERGLL